MLASGQFKGVSKKRFLPFVAPNTRNPLGIHGGFRPSRKHISSLVVKKGKKRVRKLGGMSES